MPQRAAQIDESLVQPFPIAGHGQHGRLLGVENLDHHRSVDSREMGGQVRLDGTWMKRLVRESRPPGPQPVLDSYILDLHASFSSSTRGLIR